MAEVNLDRPSVLVVEDNSFIRVLLGNVIRSLGVESVLLSPSASAAIDQIHKVNNNPAAAGISVIDLAVVDVVMPEVDGHMLLRAADSKIEAVAGDYSDWALKSVKGLAKSLTKLSSGTSESAKLLAELNNVAHELRGQGGTFGYPLVTEFAQSLFQATTDSRVKVTDNHVEFYKAHIDAINVVMSGHVKGDGGETGQTLLKGLEAARKKYTAAYA